MRRRANAACARRRAAASLPWGAASARFSPGLYALFSLLLLPAAAVLWRRRRARGAPGELTLPLLAQQEDEPLLGYEAFAADVLLQERLGQGGFSFVYGARWCGTRVAAKVLAPQAKLLLLHAGAGGAAASRATSVATLGEQGEEAVLREVQLLAQLRHPNIVQLFAFVRQPPMLLMELAGGGTLAALLLRSDLDSLPWRRRLELLLGVACGVEFLHKQQPPVIHLDLKPQNVLLSDGMVPRVSDFGLAMLPSAADGGLQPRAGTLLYMCPEVARRQPISCWEAIDSYGMGVIGFDCAHTNLRGGDPAPSDASFDYSVRGSWLLRGSSRLGEEMEERDFAVHIEPHVPPRLAALIARCLAVAPEERPMAGAVKQELEAQIDEIMNE